jgi:hypothetical protein
MAHRDYFSETLLEENQQSLAERLFPDPDAVSQGEYITVYEFLLNPDICNDPVAIAGCLEEFAGWAQYMLAQMRKQGLLEPHET